MRYQGPNFQEKTLCFLCDFWWAVLFILALLIGLGLTRCLWFQSSCPASILIQNSTPYELSVVLQGNEDKTITLPKCTTCQTYQNTAPIACPTKGSKEKQNLDAGLYALTVSSSENSSDPMPYIADLLITQHKQTSVCLIILDGRIVPVGIPEAITESTPGPADEPTPTIEPTQEIVWLDYQSQNMGIDIQFPDTWTGEEASGQITINTDHNNHIEITKTALAQGMTISQYIDSYFEESEFVKAGEREETFNDVPWTIITYTSPGQNWQVETYNTLMDDQMLSVRYYNQIENSDADQDSDDANFLQMIQNIQLTTGTGQ
jgi:hypothetical protein